MKEDNVMIIIFGAIRNDHLIICLNHQFKLYNSNFLGENKDNWD